MSVRTYKEIITKSKELYANIRTIGKNGQTNRWAYYYAKSILKPKKDIKKIGVKDAPNPKGQSIDVKLTKKEYLERINYFVKFVEEKGRMPNFIEVKGKKVHPDIWNAYVGYLCKVYAKTGKLPSSQRIKSDIYSVKLYDYLTNEGCSGMGQCTGYYCACNSLQQSFYRLTGIKVNEDTIAEWAGTTTDGTDHDGINTAVAQFNRKYNKNVKITWYNFSELSWSKILDMIKKGAVFFHLLYRNRYGHYEPIKWVSDVLEILNSLGDKCGSSSYCGYIEYRSKSEQKSYISGISQKSVAFLYNG